MKRIPKKLYTKIVDSVPILCVDLCILTPDNKWILVKRKNEPLRGFWWPPGGRVMRGEMVHDAAKRIAREELGIDVTHVRIYGIYEEVFKKSAASRKGIHTLSVVVQAYAKTMKIELDAQSSDWAHSSILPEKFSRNVQTY